MILINRLFLPLCVCVGVRVCVHILEENKHTLPHSNCFLQTYRGSLVYDSVQTGPLCVSTSERTTWLPPQAVIHLLTHMFRC